MITRFQITEKTFRGPCWSHIKAYPSLLNQGCFTSESDLEFIHYVILTPFHLKESCVGHNGNPPGGVVVELIIENSSYLFTLCESVLAKVFRIAALARMPSISRLYNAPLTYWRFRSRLRTIPFFVVNHGHS